jgi:[ribosomal protein S5]-alanine N-acetyltransferase
MRGGDLIGSAAVWTANQESRVGEMGYTIRRDCWGQGFATEVAPLLLHLGFERLGLERIAATCDPANTPSIRFLKRAGLREERLLRGLNLVRSQRRDRLVFGCLATDF